MYTNVVVQSIVLGPVFLIHYVNGLLKMKTAVQILNFADDTITIFKGRSWNCVKLQADHE